MIRQVFNDYIRRFNNEDATTFDDYLAPDMTITNGALVMHGIQGMKDHYQLRIWPHFKETIHIEQFVSDEENLAVRMWTHFEARDDLAETLFGPVKKGETFDFRGAVMYRIKNGRFTHIWVSYNSFVNTRIDGTTIDMGMPH